MAREKKASRLVFKTTSWQTTYAEFRPPIEFCANWGRAMVTGSEGAPDGASSAPPGLRRICMSLAILGLLILIYQAVGYLRWVSSPAFAPVSPGSSPISGEMLAHIRSSESAQISGGIAWTAILGIMLLVKRRLVWPVVLTIIWSSIYWQESVVNLANTAFSFNLHFFNRGDWLAHMPFMPIEGPALVQPLKMEAMAFYWLVPLFSMMAAGLVVAARRFLAIQNWLLLSLLGFAFGFALDMYSEVSGIASGVLAWNRAWAPMTLKAGTLVQWPVYEGVMLGSLWVLLGVLWALRGQNRYSPWDHGLAHIRSPAWRVTANVLMLVGFMNVLFLAYNLVLVWLSVLAAPVSGFPSYLGGS